MEIVWQCKIGAKVPGGAPKGSDEALRLALQRAFTEMVAPARFIFSGFGATLTEGERAVLENRPVNHDVAMAAIAAERDRLDAMLPPGRRLTPEAGTPGEPALPLCATRSEQHGDLYDRDSVLAFAVRWANWKLNTACTPALPAGWRCWVTGNRAHITRDGLQASFALDSSDARDRIAAEFVQAAATAAQPVLERPARVGNTSFGPGVPWAAVIQHAENQEWVRSGKHPQPDPSTAGWLAALSDAYHCKALPNHTRAKLLELLAHLGTAKGE